MSAIAMATTPAPPLWRRLLGFGLFMGIIGAIIGYLIGNWIGSLIHAPSLDAYSDIGQNDIWVSFRTNPNDDFAWQSPVNLGAPINSAFFDAGPALIREGGQEVLYFNSDRGGSQDFYASVSRDGAVIHLKCAPKLEAERAHRRSEEHLDAYLGVSGVRELHDEFVRRGAAQTVAGHQDEVFIRRLGERCAGCVPRTRSTCSAPCWSAWDCGSHSGRRLMPPRPGRCYSGWRDTRCSWR